MDSDNCLFAAKAAVSWEYETILFVPLTPGGILATAFCASEQKKGAKQRIRILERAGISQKVNSF